MLVLSLAGLYSTKGVTLGGNLSMGGYKIVNLGSPVEDSDLVPKIYVDTGEVCVDNDGDGYGYPGSPACSNGSEPDCDDGNASVYPGATEVCDNGIDDDCDEYVDCNDWDCMGTVACPCVDYDRDGYGVCPGCGTENGCTYDGDDCCDSDADTYPGQNSYFSSTNDCGSWDYDCDGSISKHDCDSRDCTCYSPTYTVYISGTNCMQSYGTGCSGTDCGSSYEVSCGQTSDYENSQYKSGEVKDSEDNCVSGGGPCIFHSPGTCSCK